MIRLKHCLIAIGGLVMLIAAVARLNALDADAQNPPGHEVAVVHALFNLHHPETAPFPSDVFTVADHTHNTGRRVNLPYPDCTVHVSDCEDLDVINALDGFGLQTRISIPFDGPIDANTATKETVFLIRLGSTLRREHDHYSDDDIDNLVSVIGINQVVWDVPTNTLHVESDELLAQHTRYALIVTDGLRDEAGRPIGAATAFRRFRQTARGEYKHALLEAIHAARRLGVRERNIVTASVYTTQSVTSVMERIRDQIKAGTPAPANFALGPIGERAVFKLPDVASISWTQHTRINPDEFRAMPIDLAVLQVVPGAVGTIAYARYVSPDYNVHPGEYIPAVGTRTGTPLVRGYNDIYFTLYLPSGPRPAAGWPIALIGGGTSGNQHFTSGNFASKLAANGIATIGINHIGQGFGPLGALRVNMKDGSSLTIPDAGRGIDQNGDHVITNTEGSEAAGRLVVDNLLPRCPSTNGDRSHAARARHRGRDGCRRRRRGGYRSVAHLFRRSLCGVDDRHGVHGARAERAVGVAAATPGVIPEHARWQPNRRPQIGAALQTRTPSLINSPGLTEIDGVPVAGPSFNENKPLRNQPAVINTLEGAIEIQKALEFSEMVSESGLTPVVWARHLREQPLPGLYPKSVIYQFATGDQQAVNPGTTALIRAGNLADRTIYYRHDLAFAQDPTVPKNPHVFAGSPTHPNALFRSISRGAQDQIAVFLASGGTVIIQPDPGEFFEVPISSPLPEELNFIR